MAWPVALTLCLSWLCGGVLLRLGRPYRDCPNPTLAYLYAGLTFLLSPLWVPVGAIVSGILCVGRLVHGPHEVPRLPVPAPVRHIGFERGDDVSP